MDFLLFFLLIGLFPSSGVAGMVIRVVLSNNVLHLYTHTFHIHLAFYLPHRL